MTIWKWYLEKGFFDKYLTFKKYLGLCGLFININGYVIGIFDKYPTFKKYLGLYPTFKKYLGLCGLFINIRETVLSGLFRIFFKLFKRMRCCIRFFFFFLFF